MLECQQPLEILHGCKIFATNQHSSERVFVVIAVGCRGWLISQPPRAEAFSRPSAQPVSTQRCVRARVCVCVSEQGRGVRICICICVCCEQTLSSLF